MNHFNFFESAQKEKKTLNVPLISGVLVLLTLVVILGAYSAAKIRLSAAEGQLSYLESVKNNPAFLLQYTSEKEIESRAAQAEDDFAFLYSIEWLSSHSSTVNDQLLKTVSSYFPDNTKIIKMSVSQNDITIEGVSSDLDTMIGVEKKLAASGHFSSVFIDSAKQDGHTADNGENAISFSCRLTISQKGIG